jgi:hypothetical protein
MIFINPRASSANNLADVRLNKKILNAGQGSDSKAANNKVSYRISNKYFG